MKLTEEEKSHLGRVMMNLTMGDHFFMAKGSGGIAVWLTQKDSDNLVLVDVSAKQRKEVPADHSLCGEIPHRYAADDLLRLLAGNRFEVDQNGKVQVDNDMRFEPV